MKIHEYQAKQLFKSYGLPVPAGNPVLEPGALEGAVRGLDTSIYVVKAQIHAGGRGKGGGKTGGAQQPDGPIAGNGDFGVSIGGGRECCKGQCCTAEGGPGTDGKPGTLNNIADRPGAASLVNADLMLFYGKNDFWCECSNGRP